MDGKWSGNSFLLGSSSLANHGGYRSLSGDEPMRFIPEHIVPTHCIEGTYSVSY
jgi:hypothetical protein